VQTGVSHDSQPDLRPTTTVELPAASNAKPVAKNEQQTQIPVEMHFSQSKQTVHDNNITVGTESQEFDAGRSNIEAMRMPDASYAGSTKETGPQIGTTPVAVELPIEQVAGVLSRLDGAREPKATDKVNQAVLGEENLSVEKQVKSKQTSGVAIPVNATGQNASAIDRGGSVPLAQPEVPAAEVAQQMIHHLNSSLRNGVTSMRLQLNQKELGAIDVQMVKSPKGIHVTFFAEHETTGRFLENQLGQLRESLVNSGVQLSGLDIQQHSQSGQKGETFGQNTNFARNSQREFTPDGEKNSQEVTRVERKIGQTSEVDYLI
jgi:flagellar hook-length control protein FliK